MGSLGRAKSSGFQEMLCIKPDGIEDLLDLGVDLVQDPEKLVCLREVDFGDPDSFHRFQRLLGREVDLLGL